MMSKLEDAVNIKGQGHSLTLVQGHPDSTFSCFFSLETARLMKPDFMWSLHVMGNESEYTNGLCHMTKMASMPIYVKSLKKSSSLESKSWWPWKLVCSIRCSSPTKFVQMMTLGWHCPILWQGQIVRLCFCMGKKLKQWIFQKLMYSYDIKVGRCSQLNEYMKLYEYQRSRSFIDDQILYVASLGWGKGWIRFWGRLDQNSVPWQQKAPIDL